MSTAQDSILQSIKKALGVEPEYDVFDDELQMHINSALSNLNQLGVGPGDGFRISGPDDKWSDLLGESPKLDNARAYVFIKTKLIFDPPTTPHLINAYEEQMKEHEFRLTITADEMMAVPLPGVLDGGVP